MIGKKTIIKRARNAHKEGNMLTVSFYVILDIIGLDKFAIFSEPVIAIGHNQETSC